MQNSKAIIYVLIGLGVVLVLVVVVMVLRPRKSNTATPTTVRDAGVVSTVPTTTPTPKTTQNEWKESGPALAGTYADADIITLADGSYRMYVGTQPEVAGNNLEIYSATSKDGITWTKESGERKKMATFPDVIKLSDGGYRMHFQNAGIIKSATSKDGLTFTDEAGTRVDAANDQGIKLDNVAAPSTIKLSDGTYLMVYRGTINQAYAAEKVPNQTTGLLMYATSSDAKTWTKKGIAVDTRTSTTLKGWADGPELVDFNGEVRLYMSSYLGVFYSTYKDGAFSAPKFSWQLGGDGMPTNVFEGVPPGDPTLLKVGSSWYMYYGRHPEGIYYAIQTK